MDDRSHRRDEFFWIVGLFVVVACSWGRWLATGSPKVDENYPSQALGTALLFALAAGWWLLVYGWRGLLRRPSPESHRLAFGGLLLAALMLPVVSNDVYSLFAYGSLAGRGVDVYTSAAALPGSAFYPWIGQHWDDKVCVYGPTTLLAITPAALARGNPWIALLLLRVAWLLPLSAVMQWSFRRWPDRLSFHTMLWLNPLWLLEGPGQMHADVIGVTAVVAGMLLADRGRTVAGWGAFAVAVLGKYTFVFAAPWFWLTGARTVRERALRIPAVAAVVLVLGAVFFAPFWRGSATLVEPVRALSRMNPGGSITEVVGLLVDLARGGRMAPPDLPVHAALAFERSTKGDIWAAASIVLRAVALGIGVRVLVAMLRKPREPRELREGPDQGAIALGTGIIMVAAITLASHRFQSWYLVAALPFFGLRCTDVWRRWWSAAVAVSVLPQFVYVLPRTSWLLPPWVALSTAAVMAVFLLSFKARYLAADCLEDREEPRDRRLATEPEVAAEAATAAAP